MCRRVRHRGRRIFQPRFHHAAKRITEIDIRVKTVLPGLLRHQAASPSPPHADFDNVSRWEFCRLRNELPQFVTPVPVNQGM